MNTRHHARTSATSHAALTDSAKARALELRREAMRDFWSLLGRRLRALWGRPSKRQAPSRRKKNVVAHNPPCGSSA